MYRRISVPLDGTIESLEALSPAITIAQRAGSLVELASVSHPSIHGDELYEAALSDDEIDALRRDAQDTLRRTAAEVEARGVKASTIVLEGNIADALADHFQSSGTDLIVMTTHDRGRLQRLLLGSTAESVVRHVNVPVLLVHAGEGPPPLSAEWRVQHVLIALDGSAFGDLVLPHAAALASIMGADITLLSVVHPLLAAESLATETGASRSIAEPLPADVEHDDPSELVSRVLEKTAQSLRQDGATVHTAAIVDGNPSRAIVEYSREHGIDLIAMATHGRGAFKRLVEGSVTEAVLHATRTPMLIHHPEKAGEHAPHA